MASFLWNTRINLIFLTSLVLVGDRGYNFNDKMSNVGIKKIKDYVIEQKVTIKKNLNMICH